MRIIFFVLLLVGWNEAISYSVTSANNRGDTNKGLIEYRGKLQPKVVANKSYGYTAKSDIPINIQPSLAPRKVVGNSQIATQIRPAPQMQSQGRAQSLPVQITPIPSHLSQSMASTQIPVQVIPPTQERAQNIQIPELKVKVYPPTIGNTTRKDNHELKVDVEQSRPITQEMMFYPQSRPKMKLPPRKSKKPLSPPPQPIYQEQYDDDESEPLFIRNRNGVMIGVGIGGMFNRVWIGGSGDNHRFYDNDFTWYFRLGYQYYFTPYLGLRSYVHLGDWSDRLSDNFWDAQQGRRTEIFATSNLNYSGYIEMLYDFVVLENHSFGIFGGFGVGVGSYEFGNDGTDVVSDYFVMPMISAGFAYTLYLNNRFELEVKAPLRQGILEGVYRAEFSTWMLGLSYTYVF